MQKRTPTQSDVKLSPSVSREVWKRLKDLAGDQNRSLNDLLNQWITEKLAETEGQSPQERRTLAPA